MIDRIKQTVETYLNTDNRGNFKPEDFDTVLHNKVLERFEDLFFEANRAVNRQNRGLLNGGLENITEKIREKIQHYIEPETPLTYSGTTFTLPINMQYFDTVLYSGEIIDLCKNNREFNILKSANPTEEYPIGVKQGNTLKVDPSTIVDNVTLSFLRKPNRAKWTYTSPGSVEMFNPSATDFVDVDIHPSEEFDLTLAVLKGFGVNLKEQDIQALAQRQEETMFNQENVS